MTVIKMNKLSFYEQVGIVIPGAVFVFGVMFYVPDLRDVLAKDGVSIGGLGIFVIISYAAGHLLAGLGNGIENVYWHWRCRGGMPSNWIVGRSPRLLSSGQIGKIEALVSSRLGISVPPLAGVTASAWLPIFRQIYSDVDRHGKLDRGDTFNGIYGLNRGLSAAALALAVAVIILAPAHWVVSVGLLAVSLIYLYRMHRFGVHYAREVYNQFLLLPPDPVKPKPVKAKNDKPDLLKA
jgi:hypothetical protein